MQFVENLDQIIENIKTLEHYLISDNKKEQDFARDLVRKARSMLIYKVNGVDHFAPAKFAGFRKNSMQGHLDNEAHDGRDISPVMKSIIGNSFSTDKIEREFLGYASTLGGVIPKGRRKYWRIKNLDNKYLELYPQVTEHAAVHEEAE